MPWTDQYIAALLGDLNAFDNNYANAVTFGGLENDPVLRNKLRIVAKRVATLAPNAAHGSAANGDNPPPNIMISRILNRDGGLDGTARVALFARNGGIFIGFRAREGYHLDLGNANFQNEDGWEYHGAGVSRYRRRLVGEIPELGDPDAENQWNWVGTVLAENQPVYNLLVALNQNGFITPETIWNEYCNRGGFNPEGVKIPCGHYPAPVLPPPVVNFNMNLNTILYGPPGTGKTFATLGLALSRFPDGDLGDCDSDRLRTYSNDCLSGRFPETPQDEEWTAWVQQFDTLRQRGRIAFTTFHQNYAYEDFVEGIRAKAEPGGVSYKEEPGIFKRIAYRALYACIENQEYPEQGNEVAQEAANARVLDWLSGSEPLPNTGDAFPYVLVIDEINRGNMARILGELITLLEDSKRAQQQVTLGSQPLKVTLPYSREPFIVPPNLYILGTMNTADRSLIGLDVALRRRFSFVELAPQAQALRGEVAGIDLQTFFNVINHRIEEKLDAEHRIGHAFLTRATDLASLNLAMTQKVIPLLREYFYDRPQDLRYVLGQAANNNQCDFLEFAGGAHTLRVKGLANQGNYTAEHYRALYNVNNNNGQA